MILLWDNKYFKFTDITWCIMHLRTRRIPFNNEGQRCRRGAELDNIEGHLQPEFEVA